MEVNAKGESEKGCLQEEKRMNKGWAEIRRVERILCDPKPETEKTIN